MPRFLTSSKYKLNIQRCWGSKICYVNFYNHNHLGNLINTSCNGWDLLNNFRRNVKIIWFYCYENCTWYKKKYKRKFNEKLLLPILAPCPNFFCIFTDTFHTYRHTNQFSFNFPHRNKKTIWFPCFALSFCFT